MRISTPLLLAVLATWLGAATVPARAGTTLSTSVSDSVSAAVGSVSTSLKKLSQSVSGDDKVAQGPYRVIEVAAAPDQPEHLRLTLQATADNPAPEGLYALTVPRKAVQAHDVHVGQVLVA